MTNFEMEMQAVEMTETVSVVVDWADFAPWRTVARKGEVMFVPTCVASEWASQGKAVEVSDEEAKFSPSFREFND